MSPMKIRLVISTNMMAISSPIPLRRYFLPKKEIGTVMKICISFLLFRVNTRIHGRACFSAQQSSLCIDFSIRQLFWARCWKPRVGDIRINNVPISDSARFNIASNCNGDWPGHALDRI